MPASLNLLGQVFGNLKVIEKLPSKNGKTYWKCKCSKCNKEYEIQTTHLRNNTYKKCCETLNNNIQNKICPICGKTFIPNIHGQSRKFCFECSPSYDKDKNRGQNITAIRRALKKQLVLYKGGKCECCGYNKCIQALQFHHLNPEEKDFTISELSNLSNFDIQSYYKEVDKCQLLCANCHAEKHAEDWI